MSSRCEEINPPANPRTVSIGPIPGTTTCAVNRPMAHRNWWYRCGPGTSGGQHSPNRTPIYDVTRSVHAGSDIGHYCDRGAVAIRTDRAAELTRQTDVRITTGNLWTANESIRPRRNCRPPATTGRGSMTMTPPKPRADSPPLVRCDQIVEAARNAIEEHGPEALTSQIAKRAGLARPNVYRHFSSKDDLDHAIARSAYQDLRAEIQTRLNLCDTPLDVMRASIEAQVIWAHKHQNLYRFLVSRGHQGKLPHRTAERSHFATEIAKAAARYLPQLANDPDTTEATLAGLIGLLDASVLRWLTQPISTREQLIDQLTTQTWLILDHHLRKLGIHIDPAMPLPQPQRPDS